MVVDSAKIAMLLVRLAWIERQRIVQAVQMMDTLQKIVGCAKPVTTPVRAVWEKVEHNVQTVIMI